MKKHLPNLVTLLNLFCGCVAIIFAVENQFIAASFFVFFGVFFDFFDGFLARILKVQSELGIQLDSLADLITSGVVPGIIIFKLLSFSIDGGNLSELNNDWNTNFSFSDLNISFLPYIGLLIPLASAYRLAKFNVDEDQQTYFKGLPVPANTLLILSFPLILEYHNYDSLNSIIINQWFLIGVTILSCYLLNANFKLFALKFKGTAFKDNSLRYIFIAICITLIALFQFLSIPIIIVFYLLLSLINQHKIA